MYRSKIFSALAAFALAIGLMGVAYADPSPTGSPGQPGAPGTTNSCHRP